MIRNGNALRFILKVTFSDQDLISSFRNANLTNAFECDNFATETSI